MGGTKPLSANDYLKLDTGNLIRETINQTLEKASPKYAEIIKNARGRWRTYRNLLRHPHAKTLLESDSSTIVDNIFKSPESIKAARGALPEEAFELSRQRWIANLLFSARKGERITEETGEFVLDGAGLNREVKRLGGFNQETFLEAFKDSPEKLKILKEAQEILQQADEPIKRYRSGIQTGELARDIRIGELPSILRLLFVAIAPVGSTGKNLMRHPRSLNPFMGGVAPRSQLDTPLIRGIASTPTAGVRAAYGPQPQP